MDVEKVFSELECHQTHVCEEAKKKLLEIFSINKEQWLVNNMMDYYLKTGSLRIMEVLVKVQPPHDNYIFDRLSELIKTKTNCVPALNLFCFVVRKHPTWLWKVEKHRLIKDIFKLLLNEKDIVPLMSALLCIITLLPIIRNSVPNLLNDLFDVFGHLASWNCQNPNRLPDDKLVHLQLGLQMLFHSLYGMYPCNFLAYISEFTKKEKGAIFHHTIKPLLETVRVHPMLVTATTESEVSNARWKKEMEPHDVVMECAKLLLPVMHQDAEYMYQQNSFDLLDTPGGIRSTPGSMTMRSTSVSSHFSSQFKDLHRRGPISRFDCSASKAVMWSPNNEISSTGPIPLTPTPSYMLPTTGTAVVAAANSNNQLMGVVTGSSPPEAAVEATPETTPMKDIKDLKRSVLTSVTAVAKPQAVRAIFVSSQPSSPMRKEINQFNFPDMSTTSSETLQQHYNSITTTSDRRVHKMLQERTHAPSPLQIFETQAAKQHVFRTPNDANLKWETAEVDSDMLSFNSNTYMATTATATNSPAPVSTPIPTPTPTPTPMMEDITKICNDCNETDRTMCTSGGLHIPTSRSMQLLAKGIKRRNRMTSYCYNDSSTRKKDATDNTTNTAASADAVKVRRTKSCSSIFVTSDLKKDNGEEDDHSEIVLPQSCAERRLQKSSKMLAIATATKKSTPTVTTPSVSCATVASQTVDIVPNHYESALFATLLESKELHGTNECERRPYPYEILNRYIINTRTTRENFDNCYRPDQEQYQLLCLQLQYERYRRDIHAERNRRLLGPSRDKRSLEMERDRLVEELTKFAEKNKELMQQIDDNKKTANEREQLCSSELIALKAKYQNELDQNKCLRQANDNLQTRLNEELTNRKDINYELEALRGQIFNMNTELQHAQVQADVGLQCKQELARLEAEFIVMGEVQIRCRDRLAEMDNYRVRDEELQMLQETYNMELRDFKHTLEEKSSQLDSAKHKVIELQAQLVSNEKVITEQKRLLRSVKDEYEEKFKSVNKKYEVQKIIVMQMEEKIMMSLHKTQAVIAPNTCSPDTDKTDVASMDRNSPLSTSLASSESLSASLRSTELRNLQQLVETPMQAEASSGIVTGIIEGTRMPPPSLDLALSANTATTGSSSSGMASAINIVHAASSSSSITHNYDLATAAASATTTSHHHPHPHLHLRQQQQHQKR